MARVVPSGTDGSIFQPVALRMIIALVRLFGRDFAETGFPKEIATIVTIYKPRLGWFGLVPLIRDLVGAIYNYKAIRSLGWGSFMALRDGKNLSLLSEKEWKTYIKNGAKYKAPDVDKWLAKIPNRQKKLYIDLICRLVNREISAAEVQKILIESGKILADYGLK